MDFTTTTLLVLAVLFFSTFTRSALGFGDGLIAMPLMTIVVDIQLATPLVAFVAMTISTMILFSSWREVDFQAARRLIFSSLFGIPCGLGLFILAPEEVVKGVLGVLLVLFGLYNLLTPKLPTLKNETLAYLFGFLSGLFGAAYNMPGPPAVIYGTLRRWPPEGFRATLQGHFFPMTVMILLGHGLAGLWTPEVLRLYLYSLPIVMLAIWVGGKANTRIPLELFKNVVYLFLVVIGLFMLI
ncbi:MAG: sulfite exporter TauE/SafE family protein [Ardenticatenaceae bacterium]